MATPEQKKLKILDKKRAMFFSRLQTIYDLGISCKQADVEAAKRNEFIMRARNLEYIRTQFLEIIDEINMLNLVAKDSYEPQYRAVEAFDEMYVVANEIFVTQESRRQQTEATAQASRSSTEQRTNYSGPKLQRIELPNFNGSSEDWPLFYQLFCKLVHENPALTDIERVTYLVMHLTGSAKAICTSVSPTAENYALILKTLTDRFEDKRALLSTYFNKILSFKPLQNESNKNLDNFLSTFVEPVNALKKMEVSDLADYLFVHLALNKLDSSTARAFENSIRNKSELPLFKNLVVFVTEQSKILSRSSSNPTYDNSKNQATYKSPHSKSHSSNIVRTSHSHNYSLMAQEHKGEFSSTQAAPKPETCPLCPADPHALYLCPAFKKMKVDDRWSLVEGKRCYNCLSSIHYSRSCKSTNRCHVNNCSKRHHSLLHREPQAPPVSDSNALPQVTTNVAASSAPSQAYCSTLSLGNEEPSTVLLASVVVLVRDCHGDTQEIRGLLDTGSQSNFITVRACRRLGLSQKVIHSVVKGIGSAPLNVSACTTVNFHSRVDPSHRYAAHALVVSRLGDCIPTAPVSLTHLTSFKELPLADVEFYKPHEIDLLIGAELCPLIIGSRRVTGPHRSLVAMETTLGYVIMGKAAIDAGQLTDKSLCMLNHSADSICMFARPSLDSMIRKFWELDDVPKSQPLSAEDAECERFFMETYVRNTDGTFTVRLPFCKSPELLGDSKRSCITQFISLERRLIKNPNFRSLYAGLIREYVEDGTVSCLGTISDVNDQCAYYMPHHGVYRPDHPTTPLRIVFNCSAPTSTSVSLNDLLFAGPKLHADIFNVLIHFRLYRFVATSDAKRMFLRINVAEEDRKFQRFIWRASPDQPMNVFQINKVVFGNTSSPYLANKIVRVLAEVERARFPLAYEVALRDIYVDDIATSSDTESALMELYQQLTHMFASAGFSLSKWAFNSPLLAQIIPPESQLTSVVDFDQDPTAKILGVRWLTKEDAFTCVVDPVNSSCTKRNVSSVIAHIFDPLGLVAPVVVRAKLFLKRLWREGLGWDSAPPQWIIDEWEKFKNSLIRLKHISFPRHSGIVKGAHTCLLGFSDSSEVAYGACVYIRTYFPGHEPTVRLLCAKAKIAPATVITIPRLELCAALLLSQLMKYILQSFESRHAFHTIIAFTDSKVTLQWIRSDPSRWKTFVGNRITQLQSNLGSHHWRHIPGEQNPADVLSRGTTAEGLLDHPLWYNGPAWLKEEEDCWPASLDDAVIEFPKNEEKPMKLAFLTVAPPEHLLFPLLNRISSFRKLLRATAYVFRIIKRPTFKMSWITREELEKALHFWIESVQAQHFAEDIAKLRKGLPISSNIRHLDPFLQEGIVRVGGRLLNAPLSFNQKHPILLPTKGKFVDLLIDQYHIDLLHAGQHFLLSQLRLKYWIPAARTRIRSRIHNCNTCFRVKPKPIIPKMGALPGFRVEGTRVFERTGVDYAGPFSITPLRRRGQRILTKAYICVFVCLAVKAIHIELVSDLSTDCFLAAYKRFLARRGPCSLILSDGGTNFIGARRKLGELESLMESPSFQSALGGELTHSGVEWKINPAYGPWFGGLWEANIKSIKGHLHRFIGNQILTYEEFNTALVQVEAILNSRPLCVLNNDPNSPTALTPAHFLNPGATLEDLPAENLRETPISRLTRYELIDRIVQDYWDRWRKEYLQTLQARAKWTKEVTPIKIGTVVVVVQPNTPPLHWPLGVIEAVFPGADGNVRVVSVRTRSGTYRRPVGRVCPLPNQ